MERPKSPMIRNDGAGQGLIARRMRLNPKPAQKSRSLVKFGSRRLTTSAVLPITAPMPPAIMKKPVVLALKSNSWRAKPGASCIKASPNVATQRASVMTRPTSGCPNV